MNLILKLLSIIKLTTLPVITVTTCTIEPGLPQSFVITFNKINKFYPTVINMSNPVMDLKLYKEDIDSKTMMNNLYNKYGYIKLEIGGTTFSKLLNIYNLTVSDTEKTIKYQLEHTSVHNGKFTIIKYATYVNFYYLVDFFGQK